MKGPRFWIMMAVMAVILWVVLSYYGGIMSDAVSGMSQ